MIAFSCSCGMKFKIKDEFAGRRSKCPTCKQVITVPQPDPTEGYVPQGEIDGTASSVHQAGVENGVTLGDTARAGQKSVRELLAKGKASGQRYVVESEIARGGMGAVLRAIDCDIRREVAVKYMLDQTDANKKARFVEEAQITGQLEHPNIVPIHELGVDAKKRLFFSMKMVKGRSLADILKELRDNTKIAEKEWTLPRLLNIFVGVCNALAYSHSRGVVHRDLKPANIMTGDFGEVYVMDWGLAKVVERIEGPKSASDVEASTFASFMRSKSPAPADRGDSSSSSARSKVSTSREADADLTQEGAIVGTPVYMPPEQAMGNVSEINQRSDIYSLGAILYEILTLMPPIEKDGGFLNILMRVSEGDIKPPEVRTPQRASRIPRELSAIVMKALAKEKKDRYQAVEALRQDIERFQEGRSVSAKEDTFKEMAWKLVKRNKGASAASFIGLVALALVVGISFSAINTAKVKAQEALATVQSEQSIKRERGKHSAPLFVRDAKVSAEKKQFDYAMTQVNVALDYDPEMSEARLLKGQLLIVSKDFAAAQEELRQYVRQYPKDKEAGELLELCRKTRPEDTDGSASFSEVFVRQKAFGLAEQMVQHKDKLFRLYSKRIEAAWPGLGNNLRMDKDGKCLLNFSGFGHVTDLTPLHGMPFTMLHLADCEQVSDLTPLQGMPLTSLNLKKCGKVQDLTPLIGMSLTTLDLDYCRQVRDLTPLQGMPLTTLSLYHCGQVRDFSPLNGMRLTSLALPPVTDQDLTLLKGMPLIELHLGGNHGWKMRDLTPLKGMKLTSLSVHIWDELRDLTPLKGMPLTSLDLYLCKQVRDLTPLQGMALTTLDLTGCGVNDLTPLKEMNLITVSLSPKNITKGMDILRQMKSLKTLNGMAPDEFWKKYEAGEFSK